MRNDFDAKFKKIFPLFLRNGNQSREANSEH